MPPPKKHIICAIPGCNGLHYARGYCQKHYMRWRKNRPIETPVSVRIPPTMVSDCCGAGCYEGKPHEFGKTYCNSCAAPCYWRYAGGTV